MSNAKSMSQLSQKLATALTRANNSGAFPGFPYDPPGCSIYSICMLPFCICCCRLMPHMICLSGKAPPHELKLKLKLEHGLHLARGTVLQKCQSAAADTAGPLRHSVGVARALFNMLSPAAAAPSCLCGTCCMPCMLCLCHPREMRHIFFLFLTHIALLCCSARLSPVTRASA